MQPDRRPDTGRRAFLRSACCAGLCAGVGASPLSAGDDGRTADPGDLPRRWITAVLPALGALEPARARDLVGNGAAAHWADLAMDDVLAPFAGDLPAFLAFLRSEWGWIVTYDVEARVVLADENKDRCVCPLVPQDPPEGLGALCHCSEGFASRMFAAVTGAPARAEVVESILRGGARCRYRVQLTGGAS